MNDNLIDYTRRSLSRDSLFLETLLTAVAHVREASPDGNTVSWKDVLAIMQDNFPSRAMSKESLRNRYRRLTDFKVHQITQRKDDFVAGRLSLKEKVLAQIKRKRPIEYLCELFSVDRDKMLSTLAELQIAGYRGVAIWEENGHIFVQNRVNRFSDPGELDLSDMFGGETVRFAVVSDTHIGSKKFDKKSLDKFYDYVADSGINVVLHAGDLVDGYYTNRPTSILEQDAIGFQEQLRTFVRNYPQREGITTYCITGNHDYTHMRNGMANIGEVIADMRDDIVYMGHNFASIPMAPHFDVALIHPTDGSSANYLDKLKTIIERNPERRRPLMFIGHYHKFAQMKYMGAYGVLMPSFQKKTQFMDDNNLTSEVGGLIVEVKLDKKGKVLSVMTELVDYGG